ncbi:hypothetical protein A4V15_11670 [Pseudomonas oryzihabitans]|uniref:Uncharacterized protein n=1 Tax=Pseudomonas oryzihabitans TaxID=47885 RepID=A0A178LN07_9PSED|nr:hypothetical protein A4V15_11670 [Pseudomonas oryzihabitans]
MILRVLIVLICTIAVPTIVVLHDIQSAEQFVRIFSIYMLAAILVPAVLYGIARCALAWLDR